MRPLTPADRIFILSGAGLSQASGIPTFRDAEGLWEGHDPMQVATPQAWHADRELVRRFYDERREKLDQIAPNPGHVALARLQQELGPDRVQLVTQNIDGLLEAAGAPDVVAMHGSLRHLRCERDEDHPWVEVRGQQDPDATCTACGAPMRPAVVWFGEIPLFMDRIQREACSCSLFVSVGTSGVVYPAAGLSQMARSCGARCVEINPEPTGGIFHEVVAETSEVALPRIVERWLG